MQASNMLDAYPAFTKYDRNGLAATLQFYQGGELPPSVLDWAFGLTKEHMQVHVCEGSWLGPLCINLQGPPHCDTASGLRGMGELQGTRWSQEKAEREH